MDGVPKQDLRWGVRRRLEFISCISFGKARSTATTSPRSSASPRSRRRRASPGILSSPLRCHVRAFGQRVWGRSRLRAGAGPARRLPRSRAPAARRKRPCRIPYGRPVLLVPKDGKLQGFRPRPLGRPLRHASRDRRPEVRQGMARQGACDHRPAIEAVGSAAEGCLGRLFHDGRGLRDRRPSALSLVLPQSVRPRRGRVVEAPAGPARVPLNREDVMAALAERQDA